MLRALRSSTLALAAALVVLRIVSRFDPRTVRYRLKNTIKVDGAFLPGLRVDVQGAGHRVRIGPMSRLHDLRIVMRGRGNTLEVGEAVHISRGCTLWLDGGSTIRIGSRTTIESGHFAAIEGRTLEIGRDSMFATDVEIRTGDSHSLIDHTAKRINESEDVTIADHVWLGARTTVLKGVRLAAQTTVAAGAIVTRPVDEPGCVIAGIPARVVRQGTTWTRE